MTALSEFRAAPPRPAEMADALRTLRKRGPLVQCLTNVVASQWTANVLLATGASPAMVDNPEEAGAFAAVSDAVLVNLGTPQHRTAVAMGHAVEAATAAQTPWVLDPVGAGALPWRTGIARDLLTRFRPAIVRGNASEILALTGGGGGRGPESVNAPEDALDAAGRLAREHGIAVAVSGPIDHLTDGQRLVRVGNGHRWLTKVTGGGCALGAVMAGYTAVVDDPLAAATAATVTYTVAADRAAEHADGPGSFAVALLDALDRLTPDQLAARAALS